MSTDYQIYFNYNNDQKVYCIPVNPEEILISMNGKVTSADIDKFGEIFHKGKRGAIVVSFESFFPARYEKQICSCSPGQFKSPGDWIKWMKALEEASKPCHIVVTGSPIGVNFYADVTSFEAREVGGDPGTIQYSVEAKESRTPKVNKYVNKVPSSPSNAKSRPSNKTTPRTYTVKAGDCLWNIAKKFYGNGASYTKLQGANQSTIQSWCNKYNHGNTIGNTLIYPGQVLTIP